MKTDKFVDIFKAVEYFAVFFGVVKRKMYFRNMKQTSIKIEPTHFSSKQSIFILIAFVLLSLFIEEAQAGITVIDPDGKREVLPVRKFGKTEYISLQSAGKLLSDNPVSAIDKNVFFAKHEYLSAFENCFFFFYYSEAFVRTGQMLLPAIERSGEVFLPADEFINAALALELIAGEYKSRVLRKSKYSPAELETYLFDTFEDTAPADLTVVSKKIKTDYSVRIPEVISLEAAARLQLLHFYFEPDYSEMPPKKRQYKSSVQKVSPELYKIPEEIKKNRESAKSQVSR